MTPSIYLSLEDDVSKIVARLKKVSSDKVVLVCPKRCFLFSDSINLRLLKKQVDLLNKEVFILTMDEKGQMFAKEAGFQLKFFPKTPASRTVSDIRTQREVLKTEESTTGDVVKGAIVQTARELKNIASKISRTTGGLISKSAGEVEQKQFKQETAKHKILAPAEILVRDTVFPAEAAHLGKLQKKRAFNQKFLAGLVGLSLIIILAVVFVILPSAEVTIYPKSEPVTRDMEVSASTNTNEPDPMRLIMPAQKFEETLEAKEKFLSQGKKEVGNKARGTVKIYNFTGQPINLRANTTVLTAGNRNYVLTSDIILLKPTRYLDPKTKEIDLSSLDAAVEVVASEGGESYNLPAGSRMEITNQVFGSRPQLLYAKTDSAISGGTSRYLSVVSQEDIVSSQRQLSDALLSNLRKKLAASGLTLPDKTYNLELMGFSTDKPAGTESPSFEASLKVKITGLAINQQDLEKIIMDRIKQTLSDNKLLEPKRGQAIDFKIKTVDINNGLEVLDVHFEGRAVYNIDLSFIAPDLVGKSQSQVREILKSRSDIDRIDVILSPSWQKTFPWFSQKIIVKRGVIGD